MRDLDAEQESRTETLLVELKSSAALEQQLKDDALKTLREKRVEQARLERQLGELQQQVADQKRSESHLTDEVVLLKAAFEVKLREISGRPDTAAAALQAQLKTEAASEQQTSKQLSASKALLEQQVEALQLQLGQRMEAVSQLTAEVGDLRAAVAAERAAKQESATLAASLSKEKSLAAMDFEATLRAVAGDKGSATQALVAQLQLDAVSEEHRKVQALQDLNTNAGEQARLEEQVVGLREQVHAHRESAFQLSVEVAALRKSLATEQLAKQEAASLASTASKEKQVAAQEFEAKLREVSGRPEVAVTALLEQLKAAAASEQRAKVEAQEAAKQLSAAKALVEQQVEALRLQVEQKTESAWQISAEVDGLRASVAAERASKQEAVSIAAALSKEKSLAARDFEAKLRIVAGDKGSAAEALVAQLKLDAAARQELHREVSENLRLKAAEQTQLVQHIASLEQQKAALEAQVKSYENRQNATGHDLVIKTSTVT